MRTQKLLGKKYVDFKINSFLHCGQWLLKYKTFFCHICLCLHWTLYHQHIGLSLAVLNCIVDTFGNCQRPVFSLGVCQHMHTILKLWKFFLTKTSQFGCVDGIVNQKINLVAAKCLSTKSTIIWYENKKLTARRFDHVQTLSWRPSRKTLL